ncbi:type VII secretion-associated serine protease mycosin [Catellatospora sp. KI3]|uniref:type VII secretion-associated serine protease mycosin n=1 Tax=Catellatospora sp. KI3 TaxID=3041620 RepID=UPI002482C7A2|nr:type VII secretion-associated serine protease mycosin [Catellatospora sp. KI3]MDI1465070.1 type VII secretion-associated serine protease mycosin [Catellatospora sp. KI3]
MFTLVVAGLALTAAAPASPDPLSVDRTGALRASRDSVRDDQWQLRALDAAGAWKLAKGEGVTVAVVDSGVSAHHPDLTGQVLAGLDLVGKGGDGSDDRVGHGTTVAALIAGRDDDNRGVVGLAPAAKILPVRVLDAQNRYDDARVVAEGVRWAVDHGARVINLSLGGGVASDALAEAIDYAFARDVVVVACVGNVSPDGPSDVWYPAREPGVLAVTAVSPGVQHSLWQGSLTGEQAVLAAPGTDLVGARPGGYWRVQGTSFAAPLVSATAALVRSRFPHMSAADVVERLTATAQDLGAPGRDDQYGFGLVDPVAALTADVAPVESNRLDSVPPPGRAGFGAAPGVSPEPSPTPEPGPLAPARPVPAPGRRDLAVAATGVVLLVGGALTLLRRLGRHRD